MRSGRFPQIVHTWMYGQADFERVALSLKEIGADGADLGITFDGEKNSPRALERVDVRGILANENLRVRCVTPLFNRPDIDLSSPDAPTRRAAVDFAVRGLELAERAGCDRMMVAPSWFSVKHTAHGEYEDDFKRSAEAVREIALEAGKRGVILLIEPINRFRVALVRTVADAKRMLAAVGLPNLGLAADTYHMNMEEDRSVASGILAAGGALRCLHLGENNRKPPGFGSMDWKSILLALSAIDFDGPLSHEPVFLGFDERRVCSDPEFHRSFQQLLGHGIRHINMIMDTIDA